MEKVITEQARANGRGLGISTKSAIMVCAYLRKRKVSAARRILTAVIAKKEAIPFTRFTNGVGHRVGIPAAGRYPIKACDAILKLIESAVANATDKGMTGELVIVELRANKANSPMRQGRQSRREAKRTHVHVVLEEIAGTRKAAVGTKVKKIKETDLSLAKPAEKPADKPADKPTEKKKADENVEQKKIPSDSEKQDDLQKKDTKVESKE